MYKEIINVGINGELDLAAHKEEEIMGYCENCGALLVHKEGRIMKFDNGSWQKLFCSNCFDLEIEKQYSHV